MADRDKVIGGLVACTGETYDCAGHTCPYWDFDDSVVDHGCRIQMELDALALLKEQPEIVRCKDCKYSEPMCKPWEDIVCTQIRATHCPDWFCADGERR